MVNTFLACILLRAEGTEAEMAQGSCAVVGEPLRCGGGSPVC